MSNRTAARLAWSLWTLCVLLTVAAELLRYMGTSAQGGTDLAMPILFSVLFLTFPTVGAFVVSRRSENPIGWIFCVAGLVIGVQVLASRYADYAFIAGRRSLPGEEYAAWISSWIGGQQRCWRRRCCS